ncbi:MAG: DUF4339 domain-containing protein [Deltaproteobacteria bacterium]|nr:DUF4339 domain-containing protein [Deltaproteobacteria bacterium]
MKTECLSCRTSYEFPDDEIQKAGPSGLRVRCRKCSAVMVVSKTHSFDTADADTANDLPRSRRKLGGSEPELTDIHGLVAAADPLPAEKDGKGNFRARKGVRREVTGMHLSQISGEKEKVWYAAIAGKSRGPFCKKELVRLAEKGKVRGSTLVWRPGFSDWTRVRARSRVNNPELLWLRDVVVSRKRRERLAQAEAKRAMGIHPIVLQDSPGIEPMSTDALFPEPQNSFEELPAPSILSTEHGKVIAAGALWGLMLLMVAVLVSQTL